MHSIVFYIATLWVVILIGLGVVLTLRADSVMRRILALEFVTTLLIALFAIFAGGRNSSNYLDAALMLALLAFVGTLAAARFASDRRIY